MPTEPESNANSQIPLTVMRCSRCNERLVVIGDGRTKRCDNCGAAYRRKGSAWIGDMERWTTKDGWKRITN